VVNIMQFKTPEERKAIAQKGRATRKANKEKLSLERADALLSTNRLRQEIAALENRLAALTRHEEMGRTALRLTSRALLRTEEIVAQAMPCTLTSGVYFLVYGDEVVYVGQSRSVFARVSSHVDKTFDRFAFVPCSHAMLDQLESLYIHVLRPKLNGNICNREKVAPLRLDELFGDLNETL